MLVAAAARRRSRDSITSNLPPPCTDPIHSDKAVCVEATWCKGLPARAGKRSDKVTGRGGLALCCSCPCSQDGCSFVVLFSKPSKLHICMDETPPRYGMSRYNQSRRMREEAGGRPCTHTEEEQDATDTHARLHPRASPRAWQHASRRECQRLTPHCLAPC